MRFKSEYKLKRIIKMNSVDLLEDKKTSFTEIFQIMAEMKHEQIDFCHDEATGLKAIIAVHNTVLGPALGGTRVWDYKNEADAIKDVLRLSRGMTYKSSISGINLGGGKAVIISDPRVPKNEAFWRRYGKFVNSLNGKYITAEDVGTSTREMEFVASETVFVAGKPLYMGGSGDPSPVTAHGVYLGMKAAVKRWTGNDSLEKKRILVQGAGHVGQYLIAQLMKENAHVIVADINEKNLEKLTNEFKVEVVNPEEVYQIDMDIYSPCALGATLNSNTIPQLKCAVIAGAANNQLEDEEKHGSMITEKGIFYAPDFLINAGGVINCYTEVAGIERTMAKDLTAKIYDKTLEIFETASKENVSTHKAALLLAESRIQDIARLKSIR